MGEVAEMMLDGTLCQVCGVYIDDKECAHPRSCEDCAAEEAEDEEANHGR